MSHHVERDPIGAELKYPWSIKVTKMRDCGQWGFAQDKLGEEYITEITLFLSVNITASQMEDAIKGLTDFLRDVPSR